MHEEIAERIITELSKGDRIAGELKSVLQGEKEAVLWTGIVSLKTKGKIEHYFQNTQPSPILTYRLIKSKSSPIPPWGQTND
jgi:hypothetical protein